MGIEIENLLRLFVILKRLLIFLFLFVYFITESRFNVF